MAKFGFLRETQEIADASGINKTFNICRTGLDTYLKYIFPEVDDWVHDKPVQSLKRVDSRFRFRPDYLSESMKIIVECDGLPHYQNPDVIIKDREKTKIMEEYGYKVVRIPFFIQLTKEAIKELFDVDVVFDAFPEDIPSLSYNDRCTPAYLCPLGIKRMAAEFKRFPKQFEINVEQLRKENDDELTGLSFLENEYNLLK